MATVVKGHPAYAGQALYTRRVLSVYDTLVYGFNYPVIARCPKARLIEHYDAHVSTRHLDIGVGTGQMLDECRFPSTGPSITVMDLNQDALAIAARRIGRYAPAVHRANALEPWGLPAGSFDSVAMTNLLHCLPGAMPDKAVVFEHAREALAPGGVLFGVTLPGSGVRHTRLSRAAIGLCNRRGIFSNLDDRLEDLDAALERVFDSHQIRVEGIAALFAARLAG